MQDLLRPDPNSIYNDELDFRELFMTLWAYKLFIVCTCAFGIFLGGFSSQTSKKIYTSTAVYKVNTNKSSLLSGELSAVANLTGLSSGIVPEPLPIDKVTGRVFIEKINNSLNFELDPYFNTYNPNSVDPAWKAYIKKILGIQKTSKNIKEAIWQGIIKSYSKNIALAETDDGSIEIAVTHEKAQRAADIANKIMDEIILSAREKSTKEQDEQLSYLSNSLANALNDLEISQSKLKKFALENSALPLESFAARSTQLDLLREQLSRTSVLHEAAKALLSLVTNKTTDQKNYFSLRQKHPIVDQVEFRRVLGQNEIISSWSWPDASSVAVVFDTLTERLNRLQSQINASQIDAERSGRAMVTYENLKREAKISEATYTVLIESVKAQSMIGGYHPDNYEVYEYAYASINPSSSSLSKFLALGAILGLFVGAGICFLLARIKGVYYSKNTLIEAVEARYAASIRALKPLRNKSLNKIIAILSKKQNPVLRDIAVEIHKSDATQVVITSSRAKLTSNDVARSIASYIQSHSLKIAIIDFSAKISNQNTDTNSEKLSTGPFNVAETAGNVSTLIPDGDLAIMELLSQRDFVKNIQSLSSSIDLLFLCADNNDSISLLSALDGQKTFHITLARTKKTKSTFLTQMRSRIQIQGLLYD